MSNVNIIDALLTGLNDGDDRLLKIAKEGIKTLIKKQLFERGIARRLFDINKVTAKDLDPDLNSEQPRRIIEKDDMEATAASISFRNRADLQYYSGSKFEIRYYKIAAPEYIKSQIELMTYKHDPKKLLKEKVIYGIENKEDSDIFNQLKLVAGQNDSSKVNTSQTNTKVNKWWNPSKTGGAGYESTVGATDATLQTVILGASDQFTPEIAAYMKKLMVAKRLHAVKFLCHENLYLNKIKWKATDYGRGIVEPIVKNDSLVEKGKTLVGLPCHTTIKDDIIPPNELWLFTDQNYFGCFEQLRDLSFNASLVEDDFVSFKAHEFMGFSIGNTNGVIRFIFDDEAVALV